MEYIHGLPLWESVLAGGGGVKFEMLVKKLGCADIGNGAVILGN